MRAATVNDPPVVLNQSYSVNEDQALAVNASYGLLRGSYDVDGDLILVVNATATINGSLNVQPNGLFNYVPYPNYNGFDSFVFVVTDNQGGFARGVVNITVGEY